MIDDAITQVNKIIEYMGEAGGLSARTLALAVECNQRYLEYLDGLLDNINSIDFSVTVQTDGKRIKFKNIDAMAEWMAEVMQ
jgi:hypothetical protein